MAQLQLRQLRKQFGTTPVVHGIDLDIPDGEFVVLVGPSGCGKSTLLRMIAGLESISGGELLVGGQRANDLPPQKRNMAMVFQSYALYPHLSVFENIAFGPRSRGEKEADFRPRIEKAAGMLNLAHLLDRLPRALSGGQRQRVAMGRAVVREPALFLFDEPLSNLDAQLRVQMRAEIKTLHQRLRNTILYVTHDQVEAMTMADRIVVMRAGHVEQVGRPLELYDRPVNRFVASFIGSPAMNFVDGQIRQSDSGLVLDVAQAAWPLGDVAGQADLKPGQPLTLGLRPEHLVLSETGLPMAVTLVEATGNEAHVHGQVPGSETPWCVVVQGRTGLKAGDTVHLQVREPRLAHFFHPETERHVLAPAEAAGRVLPQAA